MSRDQVLLAASHRLFPNTGLHPEHPHCDPVMGVVLDQYRRDPGARVARPAHRAHDDHPEYVGQQLAAESVVHQGDRRLDVHVPYVCLCRPARVRTRQCRVAAGDTDTE